MDNQAENFRNRFKMKKELGKGAAGMVYLAFDNYLQQDVALKFTQLNLFDDVEDGARNRRMWLNETRLAGKLTILLLCRLLSLATRMNLIIW